MAEVIIRFEQVGKIKEGQYILIDGVVCKIDSIDKSKPGKHGAAKARMVATGVFNDKKMNFLKGTQTDTEVPILDKGNGQIIADLGEKYQMMDIADYQTYEVEKREFTSLQAGDEVEYIKAGDNIRIVRKKS